MPVRLDFLILLFVINYSKIKFVFFVFLLFALNLSKASARQFSRPIACENQENVWERRSADRRTCFMKTKTAIDSMYTTIERDRNIEKLDFNHNKKIRSLPIEVAISFPNLKTYSAWNCSIKSIAKINFKDLINLQTLYLMDNQITTIPSNTFDDLASIVVIKLGEENFDCSNINFNPDSNVKILFRE